MLCALGYVASTKRAAPVVRRSKLDEGGISKDFDSDGECARRVATTLKCAAREGS